MSATAIGDVVGARAHAALAWILGLLLGLASLSSQALAARRVALVIGNSAYAHTRALPNAHNDAEMMASFLNGIGFEVTAARDTSYSVLRTVLRQFGTHAIGADIALVYYAGHGLEAAGENYLVPVDAKLASSMDLEYEAVTLKSLLDILRAPRLLNLVLLDACRTNPLAERMVLQSGAKRSVTRGLARIEPKGDVVVAFAANAGTVALDGSGANSPYVEALVNHLGVPGVDIRLAFGGVRDRVLAATGNQQEPVIFGSLGGRHISLVPTPDGNAPAGITTSREHDAKVAWESAKDSCNVGDLKLFSARYQDTYFGDLAARRIDEIEKKSICASNVLAVPDIAMIRKVQLELQRTGCFAGQPSGVWGARSDAALRLYRQHAKAAADLTGPSAATLETLRAAKGRVCPLQCGIDEKAERGRCVKLMRGNAPAEQPVDWVAPPAMKPARAAKPVVTGGCDSIRSACAQLRAQCMRSCRVALADKTSGNCSGCITSYSQCISRGSSGACP